MARDILRKQGINLPKETLANNKKEGRCSGHCCVGFTFPLSIQDIKNLLALRKELDHDPDKLAAAEIKLENGKPLKGNRYLHYSDAYFEYVLEMLIPADSAILEHIHPNSDIPLLTKMSDLSIKEKYAGFYRCSKFDSETGNCTAYEQRPDFCRDFSTSTCNYVGCTGRCSKSAKDFRHSLANSLRRIYKKQQDPEHNQEQLSRKEFVIQYVNNKR